MFAAVGGPVDSPLGILSKRMAKCSNIRDIRVLWVDADLPYVARLLKA
jgi:hypothetical protein